MRNEEFYPVVACYTDAKTCEKDRRRQAMRIDYGMSFLNGTYIIGDDRVLDVAIQWENYPSFCGGLFAHSPQVNIHTQDGNAYEGLLEGASRIYPASEVAELTGKMVDLRDHLDCAAWSSRDWERYGNRLLANALLSVAIKRRKRGIILSGRASGEVSRFVNHAKTMKYVRTAVLDMGDAGYRREEYAAPRVVNEYLYRTPVRVTLDSTTSFKNVNSSNTVRWFPLVITSPLMGGVTYEEAPDEVLSAWREYTDTTDGSRLSFRDWWSMEYSSLKGENLAYEADEREYSKHAHQFIRRQAFCNG